MDNFMFLGFHMYTRVVDTTTCTGYIVPTPSLMLKTPWYQGDFLAVNINLSLTEVLMNFPGKTAVQHRLFQFDNSWFCSFEGNFQDWDFEQFGHNLKRSYLNIMEWTTSAQWLLSHSRISGEPDKPLPGWNFSSLNHRFLPPIIIRLLRLSATGTQL